MALQCAATLLVARHGEAAYERFALTDDGGWLTPLGREQVATLAASLADRRVAAVYASSMQRAVESAEVAATALSVRVGRVTGLEEIHIGDLEGASYEDPRARAVWDGWMAGDLAVRFPGAETGVEVVARVREALQTIADQHRGETVLVFSHGSAMALAIPRLETGVRTDLARAPQLANAALAEVEVGDDGWRVVSWPGTAQ